MTEDPLHTGKCLCGAVKLEIISEPRWVGHCHCPSCQKVSGTGFATYVGFAREHVRVTGDNLKLFKSTPGVKRFFCGECGCPIIFEGEAWPGETHVHLSVLDKAADLKPIGHAHIKTRMPWVHLEDELIKFETFPRGTI